MRWFYGDQASMPVCVCVLYMCVWRVEGGGESVNGDMKFVIRRRKRQVVHCCPADRTAREGGLAAWGFDGEGQWYELYEKLWLYDPFTFGLFYTRRPICFNAIINLQPVGISAASRSTYVSQIGPKRSNHKSGITYVYVYNVLHHLLIHSKCNRNI